MSTLARTSAATEAVAAPLRSQTDVVVHGIKEMITTGRLAAGSRLPIEKDLADELGVSRSSLREGVRALALMGVLETRQGDGTYVTSLDASLLLAPMGFVVDLQTPADSAHLQAVRRVLETESAALAAQHFDVAAVEAATAVLASVEPLLDHPDEADHDTIMEADIAFHRIIAHASGNPALEALIESLASRTIRGRMWRAISVEGAVRSTHREHLAILSALALHDSERARLRMATHLLEVEDYIVTHPIAGAGSSARDAQ
ncbi:GntR family transcriptional regulator [Subtercola boreus]|uniref:GntR family transcriptional regulator n=1 Tax=Subtercola boreus TaxID=120213 RepID=A0A3E0VLG7_9MICO|nr:FCD domain-containing protein [Subtercola boreus]RFA10812.1 GntR family transcriptional regulator [Subtercola boreus]TQL55612.1 GntR family transcriptional regulator [Subtercola boreus]